MAGPVPALNARVIACEGQDLKQLLDDEVAPYVDRRTQLDGPASQVALHVTHQGLPVAGMRLLGALFRQARPEDAAHAAAFWRVSDLAVLTHSAYRDGLRQVEGDSSASYRFTDDLLARMRDAPMGGQPWAQQPSDDSYVTTTEPGPPFTGKLIVVTDAYCVSACLDFIDLVKSVPGALHVGETTSADTVYLDVAQTKLPSGLVAGLGA